MAVQCNTAKARTRHAMIRCCPPRPATGFFRHYDPRSHRLNGTASNQIVADAVLNGRWFIRRPGWIIAIREQLIPPRSATIHEVVAVRAGARPHVDIERERIRIAHRTLPARNAQPTSHGKHSHTISATRVSVRLITERDETWMSPRLKRSNGAARHPSGFLAHRQYTG